MFKILIIITLIFILSPAISKAALSNAPAWVNTITPGTWKAISLNTPADVDPEDDPAVNPNYPNSAPWHGGRGQKHVIEGWCGGVFADGLGQYGSLILYGGGHAGYFGSEVYAFDLDSLKWCRLTDPYPGPYNWPYNDAAYPDGSAIPPHTYDFVNYHPFTHSFVLLRGVVELGPPSNSVTVGIMHMLDLGTLQWRHSANNTADKPTSGGYSVYDTKRDVFWVEGGSGGIKFVQYDPKGQNPDGTYGSFQNYTKKLTMTDSQAEYEPNNDLFVVTAFRNDTVVYAVDLSNPASSRVRLNEGGTPPAKQAKHGWEWSNKRRSIIYWRRGGDVYEFKPPSGDWRTGIWSWGKITDRSNTVVPQEMSTDNGVYSRFRIAEYNDVEVAVVINRIDGPVYAFRIPVDANGVADHSPGGVQQASISIKPNPFSSNTNIQIDCRLKIDDCRLKIYNANGVLVDNLTSKIKNLQSSILNQITWNPSHLPTGLYFLKATIGNKQVSKRLFLQK